MKTTMTTLIILLIPYLSKKISLLGSLLAAIPMVSILAMVWMYVDGQPNEKIGEFSNRVFWMVLPSLPMLLILPKLLQRINFPHALLIGCAITGILYLLMIRFLKNIM